MSFRHARRVAPDLQQVTVESLKKRIGRALATGNARRLEELYVRDLPRIRNEAVYSHFITAFMTLRRPQRAIDVFNQIPGRKSIQIWDAMIRGFGMAKDVEAVQKTWDMARAEVEPDARLWTTRIHALASRWQLALEAFEGMVAESVPTVETLNSLIPCLIANNRPELDTCFAMAKKLGIEPDIYTYNILLKSALDDSTRLSILQLMKKTNTRPDVATMTMLLDNPLVFKEMRSLGIEPNNYTFATIIKSLLPDTKAAYALIEHMQLANMPVPSHVYTTMFRHHFSESDPTAVVTLWKKIRNDPNLQVDVVFFDRLIEGFAQHGLHGNMKLALMDAGKAGCAPGWPALTMAVQALHAVDPQGAAEIIADTREEDAKVLRHRSGKAHFFNTIKSLGY